MEEETTMEIGGDPSDDFIDDTEDDDAMGDDEGDDDMGDDKDDMGGEEIDGEGDAEERISDLEDALEELKAEFEALMAGEENEPEHSDMFGDEEDDMSDDMSDEEDEADEGYRMESRRMTREYHEKVTAGHGAEKKGAAETGDGKSGPVSSAKGRPSTDAKANNIAQGDKGADPKPGVGGVLKKGGEFVKSGTQNVGNTKAKGYSDKAAKPAGEKSVNSKPIVGG
jgi:hypothetical protein